MTKTANRFHKNNQPKSNPLPQAQTVVGPPPKTPLVKEKAEVKEEKIKTDVLVQHSNLDQASSLFIPPGHTHFYIGFTMSYAVKSTIHQYVSQCFHAQGNQNQFSGDWYGQESNMVAKKNQFAQDEKIVPSTLLSFALFDLGIRPIVQKDLIKKAMQKLSPKYAAMKMIFKSWLVEKVDGYYCLSLELKDRYQIFEILKEELGAKLFTVGFETEEEDARIFCAYSKSEIIPPSQLPLHSITINQLSLFQRPENFSPDKAYEIVYSTILPKDLAVPSYEEPKVDEINAEILQRLEENLKSKQIQPKKHRRHKNADITTIDKEIV